MYRSRLSPWSKLGEFIDHAKLNDRFLFSPLYGLGDRAAFYAYLDAFRSRHGCDIAVLCLNGKLDPVAGLFTGLDDRVVTVPKELVVSPLEMTHWVYGSPAPNLGGIFFTWHWAYGDSSRAAEFERLGAKSGVYTHKNLIKEILNLPQDTSPAALRRPTQKSGIESPAHRSRRVMLCPASTTISGPPADWWSQVAETLISVGLEPVFNSSSSASASQIDSQNSTWSSRHRSFDGSIGDFLDEVAHYRGVVTARSGLCELLALADSVPYVIVSKETASPFWRLGEGFGRSPVSSFSYAELQTVDVTRSLGKLFETWSAGA